MTKYQAKRKLAAEMYLATAVIQETAGKYFDGEIETKDLHNTLFLKIEHLINLLEKTTQD